MLAIRDDVAIPMVRCSILPDSSQAVNQRTGESLIDHSTNQVHTFESLRVDRKLAIGTGTTANFAGREEAVARVAFALYQETQQKK